MGCAAGVGLLASIYSIYWHHCHLPREDVDAAATCARTDGEGSNHLGVQKRGLSAIAGGPPLATNSILFGSQAGRSESVCVDASMKAGLDPNLDTASTHNMFREGRTASGLVPSQRGPRDPVIQDQKDDPHRNRSRDLDRDRDPDRARESTHTGLSVIRSPSMQSALGPPSALSQGPSALSQPHDSNVSAGRVSPVAGGRPPMTPRGRSRQGAASAGNIAGMVPEGAAVGGWDGVATTAATSAATAATAGPSSRSGISGAPGGLPRNGSSEAIAQQPSSHNNTPDLLVQGSGNGWQPHHARTASGKSISAVDFNTMRTTSGRSALGGGDHNARTMSGKSVRDAAINMSDRARTSWRKARNLVFAARAFADKVCSGNLMGVRLAVRLWDCWCISLLSPMCCTRSTQLANVDGNALHAHAQFDPPSMTPKDLGRVLVPVHVPNP